MLRVVDVPRAMAARGWPRGVKVDLHFDVVDELVAENAGAWRVRISGGEAHAARGGDGAIRVDVRALACLYTGYLSPFELRRIGKLRADDAAVDALAEAFAGSAPWMCEMF
jgi:predicted acetyltransferase